MAKYRGRQVSLNKPFRLSGENKKFGVYVRNQSTGNVKRVTFGQVGAVIKRNNDVARNSFLARMTPVLKEVKGQKNLSPAYWSVRAWQKNFKL